MNHSENISTTYVQRNYTYSLYVGQNEKVLNWWVMTPLGTALIYR